MAHTAGHVEETTPTDELASCIDEGKPDEAIQLANSILSSTDFQMITKVRLSFIIV